MPSSTPPDARAPDPSASIGSATMDQAGTIFLQLRAEGPNGLVGDAMFTYKKGDPKYQEIIDHVGGLEPGQSKPVPPWPQK
jgi:hypothetical protein